jgi:hypothetical protein
MYPFEWTLPGNDQKWIDRIGEEVFRRLVEETGVRQEIRLQKSMDHRRQWKGVDEKV